jgi:ABC-type glycerol-3-phosphate transport system substrate-binding protein
MLSIICLTLGTSPVSKKKNDHFITTICFLLYFILFSAFALPQQPLLAGSSKKPQEEKPLIFWHSIGTYNKEALTSLIDSYHSERAGTTVQGVFQGREDDLYLKILSQEDLPDIVEIPVQYLPDLQKKGYIRKLKTLLSQRILDDIEPMFWDSVRIDDEIYAVPFYYTVNILYVNQHILRVAGNRGAEEPETWAELLDVSARIGRNTDDRVPLFIPMESTSQFITFVESFTGEPVVRDGGLAVDSEEAVAAMKFLQNAVYKQGLMPSKLTTDEGIQMFLAGNLGLMLGSSSMLVYAQSNMPYDLNVWHLPSWEKAGPTVFGKCLAVVRSTPRREREAYRFIEWLIDYERAIKWHTHTGNPAIRSSVKESLDLLIFYEENPNYMTSVIEIESGKVFRPRYDYFSVSEIIEHALEAIMVNGEDPGKVLEQAQKEIDSIR